MHTHTCTYTHACTPVYLVAPQQEGQQHEHASVVYNPPDVDAALGEALGVPRKHGNVLGDQQRQVTRCGFPDQLWGRPRRRPDRKTETLVPSCTQQQPQELLAPRTPSHPGLELSCQKTSISLGLITYLLFGCSTSLGLSFPTCQVATAGHHLPFPITKSSIMHGFI